MIQDIIKVAVNKAQTLVLLQVYHDLLLDTRIPYEVCLRIKNKIDLLEKEI